jgi:hypothetical protein
VSELDPQKELELLEAKREARRKQRELDQKGPGLEQALLDAKALDAAESEHGSSYVLGEDEGDKHQLAVIKTARGSVIVKRPAGAAHKKWVGSKHSHEDNFAYVRGALVHPPVERLSEIIDERPAVLDRVVKAVAELAGVRFAEILGK